MGAEQVFDYNSPSCGADIRAAVPELAYCLDCASKGDSAVICAAALSESTGTRYASLLPVESFPRKDVEMKNIDSFDIFGKRFFFGPTEFPARPAAFTFAKEIMAKATELIAAGKLKPHKQDVREGGLKAVLDGINDLRAGKIRAAKGVVKM